MAITLRKNKGSALSYEELDINFHEYFYSASVSSDSKQLTLHYTGSSLKSAGGINIALNTYTGSSVVAGAVNTFQYNLDGTNLGGAAGLIYDASKNGVAIGTSSLETGEKFRLEGGDMVLDDSSFYLAQGSLSASLAYGGTTRDLTIRNHHNNGNSDIVFHTGAAEALRIKGDGKITHKGSSSALGDFVISGSIIFGKTHVDTYRSKLFTWDSGNPRIESNTGNNLLIGNERGIILEGPQSAHVVMGIQSATGNEAFAIMSAPPTSSAEPTYTRLVANFAADGKVGIGTSTPPSGYQLSVVGSISGSNGLNLAGNAVITGSITTNANLVVSQSAVLSGTLTLNSVATASSATNYNFLVRESSGAVTKQVNAAPIPQGGIIMWSGAVQSLPTGWNLCNGSTYNSIATPDLRNKFIVSSNNTTGTPTTTISGSAVATGGNTNHNHFGTVNATTLSTNQIPSHTHTYKDSYYIEYNNPGIGAGGAISGVDYVGGTHYKGSGDSDTDNKYVYWRNGTTNSTGNGAGHNHSITTSYHVPTFYALAFIMYTG